MLGFECFKSECGAPLHVRITSGSTALFACAEHTAEAMESAPLVELNARLSIPDLRHLPPTGLTFCRKTAS